MNAYSTRTNIHRLLTAAAALATVSFAQDYRTAPPPPAANAAIDLTQGVYIASIDTEDRSLRRYAGQRLLNTEGADLGSVRDFIVNPATGRIHYVVVSSGGVLGGIGNSLRLVPFEVVRQGVRGHHFEVDVLQSRWLQIPPFNDEDYVVDRFNFSPAMHQQMLGWYGGTANRTQPAPLARVPDANTPANPGLLRATVVRGKSVYVAERKVGDIENIIIDVDRAAAAALLDSSGDFTGTRTKYVIPLNRLHLGDPRQKAIGTTLTRADFDRAVPASPVYAVNTTVVPAPAPAPVTTPPAAVTVAPAPVAVTEPVLTPTGRPSAPPPAPVTVNALVNTAHAIRRAIDSDPNLVAENVQVSTENGRIVLRGTTRTETARRSIEDIARRSVPNAIVENQIVVRR